MGLRDMLITFARPVLPGREDSLSSSPRSAVHGRIGGRRRVEPRTMQGVTRPPSQVPRWVGQLGNALIAAGLLALGAVAYVATHPAPPTPALNLQVSDFSLSGRVLEGQQGPLVALFEDPLCPYCRDLNRLLGDQLSTAAAAGKLRILRLHYAFLSEESHRIAERIACAERVTPQQYLRLHREVMTSPLSRSMDDVFFGAVLGATDAEKVRQCVVAGDGRRAVQADIDLGNRAKIPGTPLIQIDGRTSDLAALRALIAAP